MLADRLLDGIDGQETVGGIDMTVRRNAFGRQVDSFESDIGLAGIAGPAARTGPFRAVFIRAPWVEQTGEAGGDPRDRAEPPVGSSRSGRGRCSPRPSTLS